MQYNGDGEKKVFETLATKRYIRMLFTDTFADAVAFADAPGVKLLHALRIATERGVSCDGFLNKSTD